MAHIIISSYSCTQLNWIEWNAKMLAIPLMEWDKLNDNRYIPVEVLANFPLPLPGSTLGHFNNIFCWSSVRCCACAVVRVNLFCLSDQAAGTAKQRSTGKYSINWPVALSARLARRTDFVWVCPLHLLCAYVFFCLNKCFYNYLVETLIGKLLNSQQFDDQNVNSTIEINQFPIYTHHLVTTDFVWNLIFNRSIIIDE